MNKIAVLQPAVRHFEVADGESILDAGLRAGLSFNYGCNNGNCGLCKARITAGRVQALRHSDYVFSDAEKAQGYALLCTCTALTDIALEAPLATQANEIQFQEIAARVHTIKDLAPGVRLLHLQTPRSQRLRFLAGQSVALSIGEDAGAHAIASCPCDDRNLQFHIAYEEKDSFSQRVFNDLRSGETVYIYGPVGDFVLQPNAARPLLMLAVDTGFAAIKSLTEHAMALECAPSIDLIWLSTTPAGHYLRNACRAWMDALDHFRYTELTTDVAANSAFLLVDYLRINYPELGKYDIYFAGNAASGASLQTALSQAGILHAHIHTAAR